MLRLPAAGRPFQCDEDLCFIVVTLKVPREKRRIAPTLFSAEEALIYEEIAENYQQFSGSDSLKTGLFGQALPMTNKTFCVQSFLFYEGFYVTQESFCIGCIAGSWPKLLDSPAPEGIKCFHVKFPNVFCIH